MRILMVIDSYYPQVGGSETAVSNLARAMIAMGHEVGVAVMSKPNAQNPVENCSFWLVSSFMGPVDCKFWGKIHHLRNIVREFKPDVMNVHFMSECGYVGVKVAKKEGIPCVLTNRGKGLYNEPTNAVEKVLYPYWNNGAAHADRYIATSQEMADRAKERYGIESLAISNGVDVDHFSPDKDGLVIRSKYDVQPDQKVLLCVRRLVPKNGIEYIVRALPAIRKKHNAILWLASPLIREYENLKQLTKDLEIEQYVRFLGAIEHEILPQYLIAADVVVQPSIAEARSLACLEAMAAGAAIVATATGGLPELITHKDNGYLVPEFQKSTYAVTGYTQEGVDNLAAGVIEVLSDDALRASLKKRARETSLQYAWDEIAKQTLHEYELAISQTH